jgi:4-hydroxy-3-methylbut-2-enyl diphosphate reductase
MKVNIEIDKGSGFCFGVLRAISKAEEELAKGGTLYCLGDIVHNNREVERLAALGLVTIDHEQFARLHDAKVLLRAHGEPPETYETARRNNIEIIDATCPVVLKLQRKIKRQYDHREADAQIVIYGKSGHAEVNGLVGQTDGTAIVIQSQDDAARLDLTRDIRLYAQTTASLDDYRLVGDYLRTHLVAAASFALHDTICRQVFGRMPGIRRFAASHDLVFLVSGRKSSNGKLLFSECRLVNANSYLIESAVDIEPQMLVGVRSIGICGATSTPAWLMEEVSSVISDYLSRQ